MHSLFHSTILATTFAATVAVGIASAAILTGGDGAAAGKGDRLPVMASTSYVTVETRVANVSTLERVPATLN